MNLQHNDHTNFNYAVHFIRLNHYDCCVTMWLVPFQIHYSSGHFYRQLGLSKHQDMTAHVTQCRQRSKASKRGATLVIANWRVAAATPCRSDSNRNRRSAVDKSTACAQLPLSCCSGTGCRTMVLDFKRLHVTEQLSGTAARTARETGEGGVTAPATAKQPVPHQARTEISHSDSYAIRPVSRTLPATLRRCDASQTARFTSPHCQRRTYYS